MRRRDFIKVVGGVAAWPIGAQAQQVDRMRLVALVTTFPENDQEGQRYAAAFQEALGKLGWRTGKNLKIEYRWGAANSEQARLYASEILKLKPDVIVAHTTVVTRAFIAQSREIPIVFTNVSDPIGERFIESFSRPGGNITGFTNVEPSIGGKYLDLLKEIAPKVSRAAIIYDPKSTPGGGLFFTGPFETAASKLAVQPVRGEVGTIVDIDNVITAISRGEGGGLVVIGEPFTNLHRARILELAAKYRLPMICPYRFYTSSGCLLSYGVDFPDQFRRAASYVDRILKGEKPSNLPAQAPIKFELVLNLKTAKSLGLTVPQTLQVAADEVIE